jgi:hypothetical protein
MFDFHYETLGIILLIISSVTFKYNLRRRQELFLTPLFFHEKNPTLCLFCKSMIISQSTFLLEDNALVISSKTYCPRGKSKGRQMVYDMMYLRHKSQFFYFFSRILIAKPPPSASINLVLESWFTEIFLMLNAVGLFFQCASSAS